MLEISTVKKPRVHIQPKEKKLKKKKKINADYYLAAIPYLTGAVQFTGTIRLLLNALQCNF